MAVKIQAYVLDKLSAYECDVAANIYEERLSHPVQEIRVA